VTDPRPTEPSRAGAAPVLDRIESTHEQMRYWLAELQSLVNHMEDRGWDTWARDHARSVIDFFCTTARQYHQEVDRQVFPLIAGKGDRQLDHNIDQLRQDQGWLEEAWSELHAQLQPVAEGFGGYDTDVLRHSADVFAALLLDHLAREQQFICPAARASAELLLQAAEQRRASRSSVGA